MLAPLIAVLALHAPTAAQVDGDDGSKRHVLGLLERFVDGDHDLLLHVEQRILDLEGEVDRQEVVERIEGWAADLRSGRGPTFVEFLDFVQFWSSVPLGEPRDARHRQWIRLRRTREGLLYVADQNSEVLQSRMVVDGLEFHYQSSQNRVTVRPARVPDALPGTVDVNALFQPLASNPSFLDWAREADWVPLEGRKAPDLLEIQGDDGYSIVLDLEGSSRWPARQAMTMRRGEERVHMLTWSKSDVFSLGVAVPGEWSTLPRDIVRVDAVGLPGAVILERILVLEASTGRPDEALRLPVRFDDRTTLVDGRSGLQDAALVTSVTEWPAEVQVRVMAWQ